MTVLLVENIALGISNAYATRLAVDTLGKGAYNLLSANDPDAVITALFANSEQGVWLDPSDLTTMFQDRAGTTPVTADGQTVGKILDKSGNDNHAVAPSDAARPLYKTDGTYHWIQPDGVDDILSTNAIGFNVTDSISIFVGVKKLNEDSTQVLLETGSGSGNGYVTHFIQATVPGYSGISSGTNGVSLNCYGFAAPVTTVNTQLSDISNDELKIRINGTEIDSTAADQGTGNYSANILNIFARTGPNLASSAYLYSLIIRGAASTTQEITDTETWVNGKTGAY